MPIVNATTKAIDRICLKHIPKYKQMMMERLMPDLTEIVYYYCIQCDYHESIDGPPIKDKDNNKICPNCKERVLAERWGV